MEVGRERETIRRKVDERKWGGRGGGGVEG